MKIDQYTIIENVDRWVEDIKVYHPDDPRWYPYWYEQIRRCVEGFWNVDFNGWRFMPNKLYFFCNHGTIVDTDEEENTRRVIRPLLWDVIWEYAYMSAVAMGFSGFKDDEKVTCDPLIKEFKLNYDRVDPLKHAHMFKQNGDFKEYAPAWEYIRQRHEVNLGVPLFKNPTQNYMIFGCHAKGTLVRMFDGSLKQVEDVIVGDKLMGIDSKPRTVKKLCRGVDKLYKVKQKYGSDYIVNSQHKLVLNKKSVYKKSKDKVILTVEEYLNKIKKHPSTSKLYMSVQSDAIQYDKKQLPFDPYWLGLWLGDGFKREKMICVAKNEVEILNWLKDYCDNNGFTYHITENKSGLGSSVYRFTLKNGDNKNNWFAKTIKNNKHIPNIYKYSSIEDRLKLLAGYIDSDGSYEEKSNRFTITSVDLNLLKEVQDVARSLGFRAQINKPGKSGIVNSLKYNLRISGNITSIPTLLPRKQAVKDIYRPRFNNIKIEELDVDNFYGFELDGDHLYLLEDYTVTHNSRGGSKSYWCAVGELLHELVTDGTKFYNEKNRRKPPKIGVLVGSGDAGKSSEMVAKAVDAMNELAINDTLLGVYGDLNDPNYTPNPLYKDMTGDVSPNNKENPWIHRYDVIEKGRKVKKGTGSFLNHVNYSEQKKNKKGGQAGAGGRFNVSIVEEVGLTGLVKDVFKSNDATVRIGTRYFGRQIFIGTSENMESVLPAKEIFTNPKDYRVLSIQDKWEHSGDIGFFLPAYVTDKRFKDRHGNTNVEEAKRYFEKVRLEKAKSTNPDILRGEKLNYPMMPSEMWLGTKAKILPYNEAQEREKELMKNKLHLKLSTPVKLIWDSTMPEGVKHDVFPEAHPFRDHPIRDDRDSLDGAIIIHDFPQRINGVVPNDMYRFTHDPYVSDLISEGGSIGVTHVWLHPKYWSDYMITSPLVATYMGKPLGGKKEYYNNQEKLLAFYGNPHRGLWYEANRGEYCKDYYIKRGKEHLLNLRPKKAVGDSIYQQAIRQYGVILGSKTQKIEMLDDTHDWLLEDVTLYTGVTKKIIKTLPCLFTIRQIMSYDLTEGNFDSVSSLIIYPLAIREEEYNAEFKLRQKEKKNELAFLSMNQKMFRPETLINKAERFNKEYGFKEQQFGKN